MLAELWIIDSTKKAKDGCWQSADSLRARATRVADSLERARRLKECVGVSIEFDEIAGVTSLRSADQRLGSLDLSFRAFSTGRSLANARAVHVFLVSVNSEWRYLTSHDLVLLLDEASRLRPETDHDGDVLSTGSVYENVSAQLTLATAARIAQAKSVKGRLGAGSDFALSPLQLKTLGTVVSLIRRGARPGEYPVCP